MSKQRRYSKEFQLRAARLVVEQGYTRAEVAERLNTTSWSVRSWIKRFRESGELGAVSDPQPMAEDVTVLRKENQRLRVEVEILKNAAAYFAMDSVQGTPGFETMPTPTRSK